MNTSRLNGVAWCLSFASVVSLLGALWIWREQARRPRVDSGLMLQSVWKAHGSLTVGEIRPIVFSVMNGADSRPVRLVGAEDGCDSLGCLTLKGLPMTIPPGGSAIIEAEYRASKEGPFRREFPLYTDCPGQFEVRLSIVGEAVGRKVEPARRNP